MNRFRRVGEPMPVVAQMTTPRSTGGVATIRLYDVIDAYGGDWGISSREFTAALDALPGETTEIRLLINSPGGSVNEGVAIMNALRAHDARVVAIVEGIAASSASFIAASADELVMMENSLLYIHNAWGIVLGDAAELRAEADNLEKYFDRNIAGVYAAKSGGSVEHWLAEMDKDRFLTAEEAVAEKLADRVLEGGNATEAQARYDLSAFARTERQPAAARIPELPSSAEPGVPNRKENAMAYGDLQAGLRERLGVTDADASDEVLLAALDETLAESDTDDTVTEPVEPEAAAPAALPEGAIAVDAAAFAALQADAAAGREARNRQVSAHRDSLVEAAIRTGRIDPQQRQLWRNNLENDEAGATALLESFPENTVPVSELGHQAEPADDAYPSNWQR